MSKYLDNTGVSYLWGKIKTALAGKQDRLTAGPGISITGNQIKATYTTSVLTDDYESGDWHVRKWSNGYIEMAYAMGEPFLLPQYLRDAEHTDGWVEFGGGASDDKRFIYVRVTNGMNYPVTLTKLHSLNASITLDSALSAASYSVWLTPDKASKSRLISSPPYLVWRPNIVPTNTTYVRLNLFITGTYAVS